MVFRIAGVIILCFIAAFISCRQKGKNSDKLVVDEFFESIKPLLLAIIVEEIKGTDLNKYNNSDNGVADFEGDFLDSIYIKAIKTTVDQISLRQLDPEEYKILRKKITDKKIKEYVYTLFTGETIQEKISNLYNEILEEKYKKIEEEDKRLEAEQDLYDNGLDNSSEEDIIEYNTYIDPERGLYKEKPIIAPNDNPDYTYDPATEDEVSRDEYDRYKAIANKGIIDVHKHHVAKKR